VIAAKVGACLGRMLRDAVDRAYDMSNSEGSVLTCAAENSTASLFQKGLETVHIRKGKKHRSVGTRITAVEEDQGRAPEESKIPNSKRMNNVRDREGNRPFKEANRGG